MRSEFRGWDAGHARRTPGRDAEHARRNAISAGSRAECDDLLARAVAHGGAQFGEPVEHGSMDATSSTDPSGNVREAAWMDPSALEG